MGREVKRVSANFDWPLEKVWVGYINPWYQSRSDCEACGGTGYSEWGNLYYHQWYGYEHFDPVNYGSRLHTAENSPNLIEYVKLRVSTNEYYTDYGKLSLEEAFDKELNRLLDFF